MTALREYQRLEATALWRGRPDEQRREVMVSLGDATLVISTLSDTALSHWSLPAVERLNPGETPAVYAPSPDADETLEIAEPDMVAAIEKLRGAIEQARPHPGRLRHGLVALALAFLLGLGIFWLPGALMRQTASLLPDAKRADLGRQVLAEMADLSGRPCVTEDGAAALARLGRRTFGDDAPRIVVLPSAVAGTGHLPGRILFVDRGLVENHETPEVLAGYLLAEDLRRRDSDPVLELLQEAGVMATLRLLTTGAVSAADLQDYARGVLADRPVDVADAALLARFGEAGISSQPYAYALDISGETTLGLIEADPMRGRLRSPLLADNAWVALQEICGG
ncbi:hypothetical protein HKCCE2091_12605 [Rhodobacterales bacterium HKCCE2091]|nr:hypothetical protein [Rhodobacterales bacterium HKCCE2091]